MQVKQVAKFNRGDQVVYVPLHAKGDIDHKDCKVGFVTSTSGQTAFCRYFHKGTSELRTTANSEGCDMRNLVKKKTHTRDLIDLLLDLIDNNSDALGY